MNDIIQIGPLNLYIPLLFYIGGIILSGIIGNLVFNRKSTQSIDKKPGDVIFEYWFVFIVIWKLSYLFKHPADLIENPIAIIYFDGGILGILFGIIALLLYSIRQKRYFRISYLWQIAWWLLGIFIMLSIEQMISLIYGFSFIVVFEVIIYLGIVVIYFFNSQPLTWFQLLGASRWVAINWVLFRVLDNSAEIFIFEVMTVLAIAVITYIVEWIIDGRHKRGALRK
ncbi:hypothetical protein [Alkalibacillus almallahensis]|uniref:hypothetical protein n=1 Tax=Alkalibacillus almallahensis TaxID=1379154 RepID=UPI00142398FA|nr:hypothetical protein [Alkalibacillus almallahensis]NIK10965.1 hypothetical protein [Alkalibacillus almallahensis]